jgi:Xaa-Pro aminopeptidase
MSSENCLVCLQLLDRAVLSIKQHLVAASAVTLALRKNTSEAEITALEEAAAATSATRRQAVADYKQHVGEHTRKAASAGE